MRCSAIYSAELIMDSALAQGLAPLQFRDLFLKLEPLFFAGNRVDDASCREGKVWVLFQYFLPRSVSQLVFLQFLLIRPILTFNEPANPLKYPPFCIEHPWCPGPTCHGWSESTAWPHDMPVWRLPCGTPNRREVLQFLLIRPILTFNEPANPLKYPPFCIEHPWCPGPTCHGWSESTAWPHEGSGLSGDGRPVSTPRLWRYPNSATAARRTRG